MGYDNCTADGVEMNQLGQVRLLPIDAQEIECSLTGMVPNQLHIIEVYGDSELLFVTEGLTGVSDERPDSGDTSPVMFAIGAIVISLIALLSYAEVS